MPDQGTISTALANALLDHVSGDGAHTAPTNVYLGLTLGTVPAVGDSLAALDAKEPDNGSPAWSNYARVQLTAANFDAAASRTKNYSADVDFGTATTAGNVDVTGWFICDAASGTVGNVLWVGDFAATITVQNGDPVKVPAGQLDITIKTAKGDASA